MVHRPSSGPDPSTPTPSAAEKWPWPEHLLSSNSDSAAIDQIAAESDINELAARFTIHGGGQVSAELSADLALEIVLNEIVEQACLATGATGAAIVLERDGEMVCRATSGSTAPELGSRLDNESGLSAACIRTKQIQRSDDTLTDLRADVTASQQLGIRSVMIYPLLRDSTLVGIFEIFSPRPHAFGERDERTLEVLAQRIFKNLDRVSSPPVANEIPADSSALESLDASLPNIDPMPVLAEEVVEPPRSPRGIDVLTWALGFAVLACAVMLGILVGQRFAGPKIAHRSAKTGAPSQNTLAASTTPPPTRTQPSSSSPPGSPAAAPTAKVAPNANASTAKADPPPPAGGLSVYENGKEVFRMPPSPGQVESPPPAETPGIERASSIEPERMELSPVDAEGDLLHRVEPDYPEQARAGRIEGTVVLDVHIAGNGAVKLVKVISGPPQLTQSAMEAVKQWKFKPQTMAGHPVEMQTTVTLNFRLPH